MKFALALVIAGAEAARSPYQTVSSAYKAPAAQVYGGYSAPSTSYGYSAPAATYGHSAPTSYGASSSGHGYAAPSYQPAVVRKDYGAWEKYYRLETETFKKTVVTDTENVWVIAFMDPACGGCKRLAVEWEKLTTVETISVRRVRFGYLDITEEVNYEIIQKYTGGKKVEYTPTVLVYGQDKYAPVEYEGDYKFATLEKYVTGYCDQHGYGHSGASHGSAHGNGDYLHQGAGNLSQLRSIGQAALDGKYNLKGDYGYGASTYGHDAHGASSYGHGEVTRCTDPSHAHFGSHGHRDGRVISLGADYGHGASATVYGGASTYGHDDAHGEITRCTDPKHSHYGVHGHRAGRVVSLGADYGYGAKSYGVTPAYDKSFGGYGGKSYGGYGKSYGGYGDSYGHDDYGYGVSPAYGYGDSYGAYGDSYGSSPAYGYGDSYGHGAYGDSYGADSYGAYGDSYGSSPAYGYGDSYGSGYGDSYGAGAYGDSYGSGYGDSYGHGGYGDSYGSGYGDSYGSGYGDSYGHGSSGYGYAKPQVVGVYNKSNTSRVEQTDYNRSLREGRQTGAYERTSYAPAAYGGYY